MNALIFTRLISNALSVVFLAIVRSCIVWLARWFRRGRWGACLQLHINCRSSLLGRLAFLLLRMTLWLLDKGFELYRGCEQCFDQAVAESWLTLTLGTHLIGI